MATWQADFHVIVAGTLPADYRERLDRLLPASKSWSQDVEQWGTDDGERIDVMRDPDEVFVRFDLRRWNPELYRRLVAFVRDLGAELVTTDGTKLPLQIEALEHTLRTSPAAEFVVDPYGYLERLSQKNKRS